MPTADIRKFPGLFLQANSFNVPDGAMEVAHNIVLTSDDIVAKRRGVYQYYSPGGDVLNKLISYGGHLMAVFGDKLGYFTDTGSAPNLTGSRTVNGGLSISLTSPKRSRSIDANKNLYFSVDQGVAKVESYNGDVQYAGIPAGIDVRARFLPVNGPIEGGNAVAYTVVFGRTDSNANLLLGSPGEVVVVNNAAIDQASYTSVSSGGGYLVTVTSSNPNLSAGMAVTVTSATSTNADGIQTVVSASSSGFTFHVGSDPSTGTLSWSTSREARIEITIPREISAGQDYFVQLYRTHQAVGVPFSEFFKAIQETLSTGNIQDGYITFDDAIIDELLGAGLYVNSNSGEGPDQANDRPPNPQDIAFYKRFALYANVQTRDTLDLDVVDPSQIADGTYVQVSCGTSGNRVYVARSGVGNTTVTAVPSGTTTINVFYAGHGAITGDVVQISNVVGSVNAVPSTITRVNADNFTFVAGVGQTASSLDFSILRDVNGHYVFQVDNTSSSFGLQLQNTAQGIVRAINRDSGSLVYASYVSSIEGTPGEMRLDGQGFNGIIAVQSSTDVMGQAFAPVLKQLTAIVSMGDDQPHTIYMSKLDEPEAVPRAQFIPIGSRSKPIRRVFPLKDSIIVLKDDGVYRLTGETPDKLYSTFLDNTVFPVNAAIASVINNQVVFLSNQGVCMVSDSGVQIVSRRIEDVIQPIVGNLTAQTDGGCASYETQRLWYMSVPKPQSSDVDITYVYNVLNGTWTTIDVLMEDGIVGPSDKLYMITTDNVIVKERKDFTKVDYCGQQYSVTINSVSSDGLSAVMAGGGGVTPEDGDVLLASRLFNKIIAATTSDGGSTWTLTFLRPVNITAGTQTLYKGYESVMTWSPVHGGEVGVAKQISQMQVHLRTPVFSRAVIGFSSNYFGADAQVQWTAQDDFTDGGWGDLPWGFFEWGLENTLNLELTSRESPIVRIYIPLFTQRCIWMRPTITHRMASEPLEIQALAFTARSYNERVSR